MSALNVHAKMEEIALTKEVVSCANASMDSAGNCASNVS